MWKEHFVIRNMYTYTNKYIHIHTYICIYRYRDIHTHTLYTHIFTGYTHIPIPTPIFSPSCQGSPIVGSASASRASGSLQNYHSKFSD